MYQWVVYLHILGVMGLLLAHGVSAAVAFALAKERNMERVKVLLTLSTSTYGIMYISFGMLLLTGIVATFMGKWWGYGWLWVSIGVLVLMTVAMGVLGSNVYGAARKLAGLPYFEGGKEHPPLTPVSDDEVLRAIAKGNPVALSIVGFGGIAIITWLMMFKPF